MALQNIGAGNRDDAFYRYKMPRMITKIEGRGNGIKTNVVNMVEIAKALARSPAYTTKYFGCELGAQSKFDEKTGISLVNGSHETAKLAGLLENFIKKFVQCYGCGNPETEIVITKSQMITLKCAACGFLSDVDMRDKLTTFIIKNPPEQKKGSKDKKAMRRAEKERIKEGDMADEEQKKLKKEATKKKAALATSKVPLTRKKSNASDEDHCDDDNKGGEQDEGDGVQWQTDTSAEAARQRIQEQLSSVTAGMVMLSTTGEKPKKSAEPVANISSEIKEFLGKGTAGELKSFLATLPGMPQDVMNSLFVALFDRIHKGFAREVTKKKSYLMVMVRDGGESQLMLLRAIEAFCVDGGCPEGLKEVALILKALYDGDVLEEEFIVKWYQQGLEGGDKSSDIWNNAKPFIEWLQIAESESE